MILKAILLTVIGFLFGAVPFSWLIARTKGVDLRTVGSGNIGATNLFRECGRLAGSAGMLLDVLKGAVPVFLVTVVVRSGDPLLQAVVASAAILGHVYTPFLGFRGGKGVATAFGALLALCPYPVLSALGVFILAIVLFRTVSIASILAALTLVPAVFIFRGGGDDLPVQVACCLTAVVIIVRHRKNIERIARGEERKITGGKAKQ